MMGKCRGAEWFSMKIPGRVISYDRARGGFWFRRGKMIGRLLQRVIYYNFGRSPIKAGAL